MSLNLFQLGDFVLNSGATSRWKLECDALTVGDIQALAHMISLMVGPFCEVTGVPSGGLRLAANLRPYETKNRSDPTLVVDDVLTTGGSMERHVKSLALKCVCIGAVVFARGPCLPWIKAVFQMPECFWLSR